MDGAEPAGGNRPSTPESAFPEVITATRRKLFVDNTDDNNWFFLIDIKAC